MTDFLNPNVTPEQAPAATTAQPAQPEGSKTPDTGFLEYNGKKLSPEDALKKITHADEFINQLKSEREEDRRALAELTELVKKSTNTETLLAKLRGNQAEPEKPATPALDEDAIVSRAAQRISDQHAEAQRKAQADANWTTVTTELTKRFGSKVNERVAEVAKSNDITLEEAVELAKSRPSVFLKLFPTKDAPTPTVQSGRGNPLYRGTETPKAAVGFREARTTRDRVGAYQQDLANAIANFKG